MKNLTSLTNKMKWLFVPLVLLTIGVGNAWGDERLTINYYSFSDHGTSYTDKTWYATSSPSSNAISGSATVCFTAAQTYIQLRNGHPAFRNTCALPGAIKSIKMTRQSTGSNRVVHIYAGTVALNNSNYSSSGTLLNEPTVTTSGVTYNLTNAQISAGYKYFYIFGGSNTLYLDNVVITYASCGGTQLDVPEVTSTPSNGQVQLTWPAVTNATKYQVSWNGGTFTDATSPYTKTSLTNGTSYTWAVKAIGNGSTYCESPAYEGATKPGSTVYTITWKVNGETYATTKVASGDHLVLPASPSSCAVGKEFAGWSATNIGSTPTDTKPTFVSSQTTASATITYYAVFATRTANSYTKGDINDLFPGQTVLIVNTSNNRALSDQYVNSYQDRELQSVSVSNSNPITSMSNSHLIWTVENRGQKFNFKTGTGYLRTTGFGQHMLSCNVGEDPWTITSANTGTYYMNSNNSGAGRLEYFSTYTCFTTYGTNATGAAYEMSFFVPTYTQYFTLCASCDNDPTVTAASNNGSISSTSVPVQCASGISNIGGEGCTITSYGFCWAPSATTTTPTTSNSSHEVGTSYTVASTAFNYTITGLTPNTEYTIRPYATNGHGTAYGSAYTVTTLQRYAISYNNNGGSNSMDGAYKDHGVAFALPSTAGSMTKTGYHATGWLLGSSSGTHYDLSGSYTTNEAATFYVEWTANTYEVAFNNNGGSGSMSNESFTYDAASKALTTCTFTPPAHKYFTGWNTAPGGGGTAYTDGQSVQNLTSTNNGTVTLYAQWADHTYTNYTTTCCATKITMAKSITGNGTVTYGKTSVPTCDGGNTTMTITPDAGWTLSTFTPSGVLPSSTSPAVATDEPDEQEITVTFAADASGTYTATVVFVALHDKYFDRLHGNGESEEGGYHYYDKSGTGYSVPAPDEGDKTTGDDCTKEHYHFVGWLNADFLNSDGTPNTGAVGYEGPFSGGTKNATGATYYAIWSKEME